MQQHLGSKMLRLMSQVAKEHKQFVFTACCTLQEHSGRTVKPTLEAVHAAVCEQHDDARSIRVFVFQQLPGLLYAEGDIGPAIHARLRRYPVDEDICRCRIMAIKGRALP